MKKRVWYLDKLSKLSQLERTWREQPWKYWVHSPSKVDFNMFAERNLVECELLRNGTGTQVVTFGREVSTLIGARWQKS